MYQGRFDPKVQKQVFFYLKVPKKVFWTDGPKHNTNLGPKRCFGHPCVKDVLTSLPQKGVLASTIGVQIGPNLFTPFWGQWSKITLDIWASKTFHYWASKTLGRPKLGSKTLKALGPPRMKCFGCSYIKGGLASLSPKEGVPIWTPIVDAKGVQNTFLGKGSQNILDTWASKTFHSWASWVQNVKMRHTPLFFTSGRVRWRVFPCEYLAICCTNTTFYYFWWYYCCVVRKKGHYCSDRVTTRRHLVCWNYALM